MWYSLILKCLHQLGCKPIGTAQQSGQIFILLPFIFFKQPKNIWKMAN
uniref:Uncharacterized protein n=1 Tax=Anguilla anguilla TaxID=7936 RepID=A0A0E9PCH4_ANGAN